MARVNAKALSNVEFESINVSTADFEDGKDEETTLQPGDIGEVFEMEVGETGQLSSYRYLRLGDSLDSGNQDSAQGKLFADLQDASGTTVDDATEFRFVARPKNGNERKALTQFIRLSDAKQSDPTKRLPFTPVTRNGRPAVVGDGRILAVEVRNPSTSVTIDRSNSDMKVPSRAGY